MDESLRYVFNEFRPLLPVSWIGLLALNETGDRYILQRCYTDAKTTFRDGNHYNSAGSLLQLAQQQGQALHIPELVTMVEENPQAEFAHALYAEGYRSALFFPLFGGGEWKAVIAFAAIEPHAYHREHLELLDNITAQVAHGFEKTVLTENLVVSAVTGLAKLAESRDPETGDHLVRMALYSAIIAEEMGQDGPYRGTIGAEMVRDIHRFAPMHDIGKVGIADGILLKPGRLDAGEREEMERHPLIGAEVLRRCEAQLNAVGRSVFQVGIDIAECHHERYDGGGYPRGLAGEAIPLAARIVAAADVFDALTSRRPYKEAWSLERAQALMSEEAGGHFDPEVVAALLRCMPRIVEVYEQHKHI